MKIESMRTRSYRSFKVDDADLPAEVRERLSAIRRYDELRGRLRRADARPAGMVSTAWRFSIRKKAGRRAMAERRCVVPRPSRLHYGLAHSS